MKQEKTVNSNQDQVRDAISSEYNKTAPRRPNVHIAPISGPLGRVVVQKEVTVWANVARGENGLPQVCGDALPDVAGERVRGIAKATLGGLLTRGRRPFSVKSSWKR